MNLTKLFQAIQALTVWVKAGLATKQSKVLVGTAVPANNVGNDGDVYVVTDAP